MQLYTQLSSLPECSGMLMLFLNLPVQAMAMAAVFYETMQCCSATLAGTRAVHCSTHKCCLPSHDTSIMHLHYEHFCYAHLHYTHFHYAGMMMNGEITVWWLETT